MRRAIIATSFATCFATSVLAQGTLPITGPGSAGMASVDSVIGALMVKYDMPGGAVAMVKDGRLVYARGFGYSDVEAKTPMAPDALFRIASLSKPITAAAILKLAEQGKLRVSDPAFGYLSDLRAPANASPDPRLDKITIQMLLNHTGGWDRDKAFDPMFIPARAATGVGAPAPASAETIIRYMRGQPLQTEPGTTYAYSNFGFAILGRIIERVSGTSYERYVRENILAPAGVSSMRLGKTRFADRAPNEVKYYATGGEPFATPLVASVFPGEGRVPQVYGGFYVEAMDAHGGWIASAIDLARFVTAVDGLPTRPDVLQPGSIQSMVARPSNVPANAATWYADGWSVRPAQGDANWWHTGSLPGTTTIMVRSFDGFVWVALFNARAKDPGFALALDQGLWVGKRGVTSWPTNDLFGRFR